MSSTPLEGHAAPGSDTGRASSTPTSPAPGDATPRPDADLARSVRAVLADVLAARRAELTAIAPETVELIDLLGVFLQGGKLLRPRFCFWGGAAVREPDPEDVRRLAALGAAIELVQAAALLHDDVMDHALTRRGRPAAHVAAARTHADRGLTGDSADHGRAVAIILGDLALSWAQALVVRTVADSAIATAVQHEFDRLTTEVMAGQYLDMLHQAGGFDSAPDPADAALQVIRWKTVPYTVLRPLRMGAALMGAEASQLSVLDEYAIATGSAFQLLDDLLGVFGDEGTTGKTTSGDILEGKRTVLLALTEDRADGAQTRILQEVTGNASAAPQEVAEVREIMRGTGAAQAVAEMIRADRSRALSALESEDGSCLTPIARDALADLARAASSLSALDLS